ncbi:hypothetical protein BYT27DRAFT_7140948 [Phlegmacium glaucopus]|nr:hypothetical protein BYT27DRAFT_7140948 [Phlegmacium glaucopus]
MGRGGDYDGEIGRGRQQDSSSSRESSPAAGPKRSFSPTSEDGDSMTPAMAVEHDTTPPLPERPLLRQPLGFSIDQPAQSINTYEASVSAPAKLGVFLPGQEVPVPLKPKISRPKKGSSGVKRPRRPEAYAGQTSRFRIQTYDPTPSIEPPIHYGSGPYSSLYRGVVPTTETRPDSTATATTPPQGRSSSSTASSNTMDSFRQPSSLRSPQENPSASKGNASKGRKTQTVVNEHRNPSFSRSKFQQSSTPASNPENEATVSSSLSGPYYRHNYESQHEHATSLSPPPASQRQPFQSETQKKSSPIAKSQNYQPTASASSRGTENGETEGQPRRPLRIVTVLIQDIRSGVTDHQLAEVKIPLKPSDDPQDGFWADSRDINQQLQASASRIDGPARAYTLRGKYRQFLLRVSADNVDEFISANVIIQPDRTLDIVVEMLHPPGAPPVVPKIPKELWPPRDDSEEPGDRMDVDPRRDKHSTSSEGSRKRRSSPSFDDYDEYPSHHSNSYASSSKAPSHDHPWDMSPRGSPSRSNLDNAPPKKRRSYAKEAMLPRSHSPEPSPPSMGYPRLTSESPSEEDSHEKQFLRVVHNCLQQDRVSWLGFFEAEGGDNRVHDIIKQYEFLDKICTTWVDKTVPGYDIPIKEGHIYKAMKIDDEEFLRYFKETITLLALYGKDGRRYEDTDIVAIVNDSRAAPGPSTVNPMKSFLGILREVDAKWFTNDQRQLQRLNTTETPRDETRSTKALFV